jgi:hypothetical protein
MVQLWGIDQAKRCAEGSVRRAVLAEAEQRHLRTVRESARSFVS